MTERDIDYPALPYLTDVPQHARLTIRLEGGIFVVDETEARG